MWGRKKREWKILDRFWCFFFRGEGWLFEYQVWQQENEANWKEGSLLFDCWQHSPLLQNPTWNRCHRICWIEGHHSSFPSICVRLKRSFSRDVLSRRSPKTLRKRRSLVLQSQSEVIYFLSSLSLSLGLPLLLESQYIIEASGEDDTNQWMEEFNRVKNLAPAPPPTKEVLFVFESFWFYSFHF